LAFDSQGAMLFYLCFT